jgi:hypothetical protein
VIDRGETKYNAVVAAVRRAIAKLQRENGLDYAEQVTVGCGGKDHLQRVDGDGRSRRRGGHPRPSGSPPDRAARRGRPGDRALPNGARLQADPTTHAGRSPAVPSGSSSTRRRTRPAPPIPRTR